MKTTKTTSAKTTSSKLGFSPERKAQDAANVAAIVAKAEQTAATEMPASKPVAEGKVTLPGEPAKVMDEAVYKAHKANLDPVPELPSFEAKLAATLAGKNGEFSPAAVAKYGSESALMDTCQEVKNAGKRTLTWTLSVAAVIAFEALAGRNVSRESVQKFLRESWPGTKVSVNIEMDQMGMPRPDGSEVAKKVSKVTALKAPKTSPVEGFKAYLGGLSLVVAITVLDEMRAELVAAQNAADLS